MATILLIEDDKFLSDLYQSSFERSGHIVQVAADAQMAIDLLDEYGADLVLLDLFLPVHNGIEVLHELQSHGDWQKIPVIILSSQPKKSIGLSAEQWKKYGVRRYLYKPDYNPGALVEAVQPFLL